ncbi:peptidoglycan DD-metalloendopeptidase family protein [Brachybacterium sp. EF45031]|uniref:M23 family metallopeptidase n=1 Tax=Brachybacterium sillae TaxID=2810536 RepID=UPI00217E025F|nr:M23 family metallopeptidase [Brachybacterium sillae]MCS6710981.1 peptidoglycan DD-metalloendopeptidase family protein [Brachybacterium sillae]
MIRSVRRRVATALSASALVLACLASVSTPVLAEGSREEKEQEKQQVDRQIEELRIELDDVNADLRDTYLALAQTELQIPQAQSDLENAQQALADARQKDQETGRRLAAAQQEEKDLEAQAEQGRQQIDSADSELSALALEAYKGGGMPDPTSIYVGTAKPQDAVDRSMNYRLAMEAQGSALQDLRTDQSVTANAADRLTAVRQEIADLKRQSEQAVAQRQQAEQQARDAKTALDALYADQTSKKNDLEAKKTKYQNDSSTLSARSQTLDTQIAEIARQEKERELAARQAAANSGGVYTGTPSATGFAAPGPGGVNSNFGWRVHPIYGTRKLHAGVDLPLACGTPVHATADGQVISAGYNGRAGNKLILSHGLRGNTLVTSSYHHLQGFAASSGQVVKRGQVIGYVGTTGSSTGCHLHFEIHEDGNPVNPMNYLG